MCLTCLSCGVVLGLRLSCVGVVLELYWGCIETHLFINDVGCLGSIHFEQPFAVFSDVGCLGIINIGKHLFVNGFGSGEHVWGAYILNNHLMCLAMLVVWESHILENHLFVKYAVSGVQDCWGTICF